VAPGASARGFGFVRAELPTIVTFLAWGDPQPPTVATGRAPSSCAEADVLENSFHGVTVGPKPPPQPLVPVEFLTYLTTLVHDSRRQGWIRSEGMRETLQAHLQSARRKLETGDPKAARRILETFLKEVRAASCQDFTCQRATALTSEAYALLFFNGQYVMTRLP
jgi:hypothetical protein